MFLYQSETVVWRAKYRRCNAVNVFLSQLTKHSDLIGWMSTLIQEARSGVVPGHSGFSFSINGVRLRASPQLRSPQ